MRTKRGGAGVAGDAWRKYMTYYINKNNNNNNKKKKERFRKLNIYCLLFL